MIKRAHLWNNSDLRKLESYRSRIPELAVKDLQQRLRNRDYDEIGFYDITPKENLPRYLQKMDFQSIHVKESTRSAYSE